MTSPVGVSDATRAQLLVEALPYIRRFRGHVFVVKYGGSALGDDLSLFAQDVAMLHSVGIRVVVVHGGGPQIGQLLARLGKETEFVDGLRVTDAETLDIARMVLTGKVNRDIVGALNVHGPLAVGVSGEDAGMLRVTQRSPELGFVGDVETVAPQIIERLLAQDLVAVVATIGTDDAGQAYNVNADTAAGAIAAALGATKLVYLTDVAGIRADPDDPASVVSRLDVAGLEAMVEAGSITGGMIPKVRSCIEAVEAGVGQVHVLDGRIPHVLLLEVFTHAGAGTMIEAAHP